MSKAANESPKKFIPTLQHSLAYPDSKPVKTDIAKLKQKLSPTKIISHRLDVSKPAARNSPVKSLGSPQRSRSVSPIRRRRANIVGNDARILKGALEGKIDAKKVKSSLDRLKMGVSQESEISGENTSEASVDNNQKTSPPPHPTPMKPKTAIFNSPRALSMAKQPVTIDGYQLKGTNSLLTKFENAKHYLKEPSTTLIKSPMRSLDGKVGDKMPVDQTGVNGTGHTTKAVSSNENESSKSGLKSCLKNGKGGHGINKTVTFKTNNTIVTNTLTRLQSFERQLAEIIGEVQDLQRALQEMSELGSDDKSR